MSTIDVVVVGGRFGSDFLPIYRSHPQVGKVGLVDVDKDVLHEVGERYGISDRFSSLEELLAGNSFEAVHVASPVRFHVDQVVAVLQSGRHAACAVPMATSLDGIGRIIDAQRDSGKNYMMMETMVFGREFFYVRDLHREGGLGPLTYLRGFHLQDLDGFPRYWYGYPPLTYSTHAISPLLALAGARVRTAHALGSSRLTPERRGDFDNPFPIETGLFRLDRQDLVAEVTVSFFQVARQYQEGFSVYGQDRGIEWPQISPNERLTVFDLLPAGPERRGRPVQVREIDAPDRPDLLPEPIACFTRSVDYDPGSGRPAVHLGSGHSGSHPHLVHEFVSSIVEQRRPLVDAVTAATWTAPGIVGHRSALEHGAPLDVPDFGTPTAFL